MKHFEQVVPIAPSPVPRQATGLHLIGDLYGCLCDSRLCWTPLTWKSFARRAWQQQA